MKPAEHENRSRAIRLSWIVGSVAVVLVVLTAWQWTALRVRYAVWSIKSNSIFTMDAPLGPIWDNPDESIPLLLDELGNPAPSCVRNREIGQIAGLPATFGSPHPTWGNTVGAEARFLLLSFYTDLGGEQPIPELVGGEPWAREDWKREIDALRERQ